MFIFGTRDLDGGGKMNAGNLLASIVRQRARADSALPRKSLVLSIAAPYLVLPRSTFDASELGRSILELGQGYGYSSHHELAWPSTPASSLANQYGHMKAIASEPS